MLFSLSNLKRRSTNMPLLLFGLLVLLVFKRPIRELIRRLAPSLRSKQTEAPAMRGQIEVYALTRHRDEQTLNRFLDEYVNREASHNMPDEELLMVPLAHGTPGNPGRLFDSEPAVSLPHTIQRGLDYPRRSFWVNLEPRDSGHLRAVLCFTTDDRLVLGLVLEDTDERKRQAVSILQKVMTDYDGYLGMVTMFESPPRSEAEFRGMKGRPVVLHFIERPSP